MSRILNAALLCFRGAQEEKHISISFLLKSNLYRSISSENLKRIYWDKKVKGCVLDGSVKIMQHIFYLRRDFR